MAPTVVPEAVTEHVPVGFTPTDIAPEQLSFVTDEVAPVVTHIVKVPCPDELDQL